MDIQTFWAQHVRLGQRGKSRSIQHKIGWSGLLTPPLKFVKNPRFIFLVFLKEKITKKKI